MSSKIKKANNHYTGEVCSFALWLRILYFNQNRVGSGVTPAPYHTTVRAGRHTAVRERLSEDTSLHRLSVLSTAADVRCSLPICSRVPPATFWESSGISALLSASFSSVKVRDSSSLPRSGLHHCAMAIMPSADFCSSLMPPLDGISPMADEQISPGITHSLSPHLPVASTSTPSG